MWGREWEYMRGESGGGEERKQYGENMSGRDIRMNELWRRKRGKWDNGREWKRREKKHILRTRGQEKEKETVNRLKSERGRGSERQWRKGKWDRAALSSVIPIQQVSECPCDKVDTLVLKCFMAFNGTLCPTKRPEQYPRKSTAFLFFKVPRQSATGTYCYYLSLK